MIDIFSNYGAITGIELPIKNLAIEQELKNKVNEYEQRRELDRELAVKRAQKLVQDTIKENADYYREVIQKYVGNEEANQFIKNLLAGEEQAQ